MSHHFRLVHLLLTSSSTAVEGSKVVLREFYADGSETSVTYPVRIQPADMAVDLESWAKDVLAEVIEQL